VLVFRGGRKRRFEKKEKEKEKRKKSDEGKPILCGGMMDDLR
jgi:hypothetical protein